jgi:hypothetical protein
VVDVTSAQGLDNTGGASAVAKINAAIVAAAPNTVLYISAGTYRIDAQVVLNKNSVVLRGATDASFGNTGATIFNCVGGNTSGVYVGISSSWGTPTAVTGGDIAAGTSILNVASSTGFAAGKMVRIMQDNDQTIPVLGTGGGTRLQGQISMITNVSGASITISPALIFPLKASLNPVMSVNANIRTRMGVENIFFDGTNKTGPYTIQLNGTQGSWVKGCQSFNNYQYHIYWAYAVQCEFRHNTIWVDRPIPHGPNMSGLKMDSCSSDLIVDNIFYQQFPSIQINGSSSHSNCASAGNVIAYNFSTQATNAQPYAAADYEASHGPHTQYDLYEGNVGEKFQQDAYYGSAAYITVARNLLTGDNPLSANNNRIIDLCRFSRYFNIVGNVFGRPGNTYTYKATGEITPYATRYIYRFGYPNNDNGNYIGTAQPSLGDFWASYGTAPGATGFQEWDLDVEATTLFKGNYNVQDGAIPASESAPEAALPSYFLSGTPFWFGTMTWPAFDASAPVFSKQAIPAGYRFANGVEAPGVTGGTPPPPPPPPVIAPSSGQVSIQVN